VKQIDARKYRFSKFDSSSPFAMILAAGKGVEEVEVTHLEETYYTPNGVSFQFYGNGKVTESAGMLLDNGNILFCVVSGYQFTDTFHSADNISMQYYTMTPL
jgi:hypothetical protein